MTAIPKGSPPQIDHMVSEGVDAFAVGRYRMIGEEPADHLAQPFALLWNGAFAVAIRL
jgi:hypothetical protein